RGDRKTVKATFTRTGGMCPRCEGRGTVTEIDLTQLFDDSRSLAEGALTIPGYTPGGWNNRLYAASGFVDPDKPIRKYTKTELHDSLFSANSDGACPNCNGAGVVFTDLAMMAGVATTCEECEGKRFQASVLECHLGGRDISEVLAMSVAEATEFFGDGEAATPAAHRILTRLADVGLGYLTLRQPPPHPSGV